MPQKFEWKQKPRSGPQTGAPGNAAESGLERDKVAFPDPATVPLPTDAEAGGTPTAPAAIDGIEQERERPITETPPATTGEPGRGQDQIPPRSNAALIAAVIAASAVAALAAAYLTLPW